jgi:hypothetical protein
LKETGEVGKGLAPVDKKPTGMLLVWRWLLFHETRLICSVAVNLILSDDQFSKLISGKANAQKLYMSGKLKVKGDVMKATKMEPILKKAQSKAKL